MKEALAEFIAFTQEHFPGNEPHLGFPKENMEDVMPKKEAGDDQTGRILDAGIKEMERHLK